VGLERGGRCGGALRNRTLLIWRSSSKRSSCRRLDNFQSADVAAAGADLLLEISDDALEILGAEACTEELVPEPLPVKAQRELLTCELAIKLVSGSHGGKGIGIHQ
jgi:hypothetical protein